MKEFDKIIQMHVNLWKKIFSMVKDLDLKKPLRSKDLSNPDNDFVKTIIYIYSMESFLFYQINRATRSKDLSKIQLFGPYASALSLIIHHGNSKN